MPIIELYPDRVVQRCALCGRTREVARAELRPASEGRLELLPCDCGAVETLFRSPPDEPPHPVPGSFGHLHRLRVDALFEGGREEIEDAT